MPQKNPYSNSNFNVWQKTVNYQISNPFPTSTTNATTYETILDQLGVAIRTGHHCTEPLMNRFNVTGTARVSFAFYNTIEEIDVFIAALKRALKMLL